MKRALLLTAAIAGMLAASSAASASNVIYSALVSPKQTNVPSLGFEATSTRQFGDEITFAGTNRTLRAARVTLSSWACQSGRWYSNDCVSAHGSTFSVPITLTVYSPPLTGFGVGSVLATKTQSFAVKYRPSANHKKCPSGGFYRAGGCWNGLAQVVKFDLASLHATVPNTVVYGLSYNTTHFGPAPIGEAAPCYSSSGGCGYDALNVGLGPAVTVGSKPHPDTTYLDSSYAGSYCDNGAAGVSTFRLDSPTSACWTGYVPAVQFTASKK
jgi:hypothetical protein